MRIIAGTYRSRVLTAPAGLATRPTSDRLRETLFNVLGAGIRGAAFLDLYAGAGAVGIEALSRGARQAAFVEQAREALEALRGNLARLGIGGGFQVYAVSTAKFLGATERARATERAQRFDVVFLDPPYKAAEEYTATLGLLGGQAGHPVSRPARGLLAAGAVVIAEHWRKLRLEERYGRLERTRLLEQGDAALSFYVLAAAAEVEEPENATGTTAGHSQ